MKKNIILGLFSLALMASSAVANQINTVFVTTNNLVIPYVGTYPKVYKVKLGTYTLPWTQAGKSANIIATLPNSIPDGTYQLNVEGQLWPVSVAIGSERAEAALNARVDTEILRANAAEDGLTNGLNAEIIRANTAEDGLTNGLNAEFVRANTAEAGLTNADNAEFVRANTAEAGLTNAINAEAARANTAEASLTNGLNAEIARANTAEAGLTNAITAEVTRANTAEAGLSNSITTTINSTSNSILASLTKDLSVISVTSGDPITNLSDSYISFTNGTVEIIGNTNSWSADRTFYTITNSGIYEISFAFNVSSAPDLINQVVIGQNNTKFKVFSFPAVTSGYATWAAKTTIQCSAGDSIGIGAYSSSGDSFVSGPEPIFHFTQVSSMEISIQQIQ